MTTNPLYFWENEIPSDCKDPVLIVCLDGWIDAGFAAATAIGSLKGQIRTRRLIAFDTDELLDQRARRPVIRLVNGVNTNLKWPRLQIRHGQDALGQHVLVLTGPEPDFRWNSFVRALMEIVTQFNVRMCIGLGAFPAAAPHTRPVTLGSTATTEDLARNVGFIEATFDIPAGVQAAIERAFAEVGRPATGVWARVPHYSASMPFPSAAAALLDCLARLTGLVIDTEELHKAGRSSIQQIDELVRGNDEHVDMVRNLEAQVDAEAHARAQKTELPLAENASDLPSGDELAEELEKFLREQP